MENQPQQTENNGMKTKARPKSADFGRETSEQAHKAEERIDQAGEKVSSVVQKWPKLTIAAVAALGLLAASTIGVGEVAIAGAAGYLAYRWIHRKGQGPAERPEQGKKEA